MSKQIVRNIVENAVNFFIKMNTNYSDSYKEDFESKLLEETKEFYKKESEKWMQQGSVLNYMRKAEDSLDKELERALAYLYSNILPSLIKLVGKEIIIVHQESLLPNEKYGFISLLNNCDVGNLSTMYKLFKRVNYLKPISEMMTAHITNEIDAVRKHINLNKSLLLLKKDTLS